MDPFLVVFLILLGVVMFGFAAYMTFEPKIYRWRMDRKYVKQDVAWIEKVMNLDDIDAIAACRYPNRVATPDPERAALAYAKFDTAIRQRELRELGEFYSREQRPSAKLRWLVRLLSKVTPADDAIVKESFGFDWIEFIDVYGELLEELLARYSEGNQDDIVDYGELIRFTQQYSSEMFDKKGATKPFLPSDWDLTVALRCSQKQYDFLSHRFNDTGELLTFAADAIQQRNLNNAVIAKAYATRCGLDVCIWPLTLFIAEMADTAPSA